jgi:hypothetical protein
MTQMFPFSDKSFFRGAKVFNEVPEARHEVPEARHGVPEYRYKYSEARQEMVEQNQILMLHQLAGKLIQVVQEAMKDGDVGEDIDMMRHEEISAEAKRVFFDVMKEKTTVSECDTIQGKKSFTCDVEIAEML